MLNLDIAARLAKGKTAREIADELGCRPEYVRAVRYRQRNVVRYGTVESPKTRQTRHNRYHARKLKEAANA